MRPSRGQINKKSDNQRSKIPFFKDSTTSILAQKHVYKTNKAIGYVLRKPYIAIVTSVGHKVCHDHNLRPRHAANYVSRAPQLAISSSAESCVLYYFQGKYRVKD